MSQTKFRVVVAGGGTGGHVYPSLAVIEALKKRLDELNAPYEITRMGPDDGYETLFQNLGVSISRITAGKMRRYLSLGNLIDGPKFVVGFIEALIKLYFIMPDVIFSKGGTGALPVVLAGWCYRIPIAIHESDSVPGLTNLASARFAKRVFVSFDCAARFFAAPKTLVTGTPLRASLFAGRTTKELAKESLGFDPKLPLTLVYGGSQGSKRVNDFILANLGALAAETQILHQTGVANLAEIEKLSHAALIDENFRNRYQATGYLTDNIGVVLTAADLAVARSGSGTLADLAAFGIPAILIPLAGSANDHQRVNAYEFAKAGAGVVIEEANLLPGIFMAQIKSILGNEDTRTKMSVASSKFLKPGAAETIAEEIVRLGA